jgi:sugar lactone lactonase YvrE
MLIRTKRAATAAVVGLTGALLPASVVSPTEAAVATEAAVGALPAQPAPGPPPGPPPGPTQPRCRDVEATVTTFNDQQAIRLVGWADNVVFDGQGGMWVSRVIGNAVQRYDASGQVTKVVELEGPAGMAMGPDGKLYVNQDLIGVSAARVVRFDPTAETPELETFATGLPGANGLAADGEGNLYVGIVGPMTIGQSPSLVKILPDGTIDQAWSALADFPNANGIAVHGDTLFVNRWVDRNSPIERVPLDDPASHSKLVQLTPEQPLVPKVLDDLTIGPDGRIYTVAYATGELLRVHPRTGRACVVADGFVTPTSVHAPEAFGDFDPERHMFVTESTGRIQLVELG